MNLPPNEMKHALLLRNVRVSDVGLHAFAPLGDVVV
jgi:hypothetical protein